MSNELSDRLQLARRIAREAGRHTLKHFRRDDLVIDLKQDQSPVTIADRESEQLLRERIAAAFPEDAVLGEEFGETPGTSGYRWILDPIDGTKSFISGVPLYGVLIGVEHDGESRIGVIHIPALDEIVYAATGQGAWYVHGDAQPKPARASTRSKLAECVFCTSEPEGFRKKNAWPFFERLCAATRFTRTWGDAYGYFLVATGRIDVMVDPAMNVWDAAALLPVIQEAGGTYTDWQGRPTIHGGQGIATNGRVLDEVLGLLRPAQPKG